MTRSIDAGVLADIQGSAPRVALLVDLLLDSGTLYLWTGLGSLSANGNTYLGTGNFGTVEGISESVEVRPTGLTMTLSGVATSLISTVLAEHMQGRTAKFYLATFNDAGVLEGALLLYQGRMDNPSIADNGTTATITLPVENRLADFERPNNPLYYTNEDQLSLYAGDVGLEFVEVLQDATIFWGREQPGARQSSVGGGGGGGSASGGDNSPEPPTPPDDPPTEFNDGGEDLRNSGTPGPSPNEGYDDNGYPEYG